MKCFGILIKNVIYYVYLFCSQAKGQIFCKGKVREAQEEMRDSLRVFCFLSKYRKVLGSRDLFSDHLWERLL